ncbi:pseudouridylate synthase [Mucor ambiguus]|uniref:Pseudouridylate synthase n=1 Tax=Mucor ambiguus TaxID=91626 RepID=A0A0C9LU50_9FUNG|nr:pseudouridylate synthase [Mucor ambiguus]
MTIRARSLHWRPFCSSFNCLNRIIKTSKDRKLHFDQVNSWKATGNQDYVKSNEPRLPKKKVALLIGFNGSSFQGMQMQVFAFRNAACKLTFASRNPGTMTIESVLFDALCKTGAVSTSNAVDAKKVQLMRAARTDKGVHASCNLVSLKMICQDEQIVEKLNAVLPPQIRVWGYVETQRNFHAKNKCDSRIYEYLMPSYALQQLEPNKEWTTEPQSEHDIQIATEDSTLTRFMKPTDPTKLLAYRVDQERFSKFKRAMLMFNGTHNFHNYTIARSFNDQAANRFMIDINVDEPMLIGGMEWISVKLHGQSFMLHQIRKMISMAMLCTRTGTPLTLLPKTFESAKINIPKAPALGLLLDRPVFKLYNDRMQAIEGRQTIDFDQYKDAIEAFKKESIYSRIFEQEHRDKVFDTFLMTIDSHVDKDYKYFNKDGVIPDESILSTKYSV